MRSPSSPPSGRVKRLSRDFIENFRTFPAMDARITGAGEWAVPSSGNEVPTPEPLAPSPIRRTVMAPGRSSPSAERMPGSSESLNPCCSQTRVRNRPSGRRLENQSGRTDCPLLSASRRIPFSNQKPRTGRSESQ